MAARGHFGEVALAEAVFPHVDGEELLQRAEVRPRQALRLFQVLLCGGLPRGPVEKLDEPVFVEGRDRSSTSRVCTSWGSVKAPSSSTVPPCHSDAVTRSVLRAGRCFKTASIWSLVGVSIPVRFHDQPVLAICSGRGVDRGLERWAG